MDEQRSENPAADSVRGPVKADTMDDVGALIDVERQAADARLESKLAGALALERDAGGAPGVDAIRRVLGTASSVPCNWHQATIFFAGSDDPVDAAMKARSKLMAVAGLAMIVFQVMAAVGIQFGVAFPACKTSKQCGQPGTFCAPREKKCQFCGWHGPLSPVFGVTPMTAHETYVGCVWSAKTTVVGRVEGTTDMCLPPPNKTLVRELCSDFGDYKDILFRGHPPGWYPGYPPKQAMGGAEINEEWIRSWCESCVNTVDWEPDMFTTIDLGYDNVDAMGPLDWATLVLASYVVALTVIGELKDIELCNIAIERLGENIGQWRHVIVLGTFLRRAMFLPVMLNTVGLLVVIRGGDSLSVCFNTVAILFMAEADNMAYQFGLAEPQKVRMETAGRATLTTEQSERLLQTRMVYVPVIIVGILTCAVRRTLYFQMVSGFFMLTIAEVIRVLVFAEAKRKPKELGMALAQAVGGLLACMLVAAGGRAIN